MYLFDKSHQQLKPLHYLPRFNSVECLINLIIFFFFKLINLNLCWTILQKQDTKAKNFFERGGQFSKLVVFLINFRVIFSYFNQLTVN